MPCGTALASTWNRSLIERVGRVLGDEARAKGASVLLAPTVNIQRHPLGGRNFECYSEDPYLTAEIARRRPRSPRWYRRRPWYPPGRRRHTQRQRSQALRSLRAK